MPGSIIQTCTGCVANERERGKEGERETYRKRTRKEAITIKVSVFSNNMLICKATYSIDAH